MFCRPGKSQNNTPAYKLTYFDLRGRGEISRMIFAAAGQHYEDVRIQFPDWAELKKDNKRFPQGTMPVLDVDDGKTKFKLSQSLTIARFLAREFNLYGKSNLEKGLIDQYLDTTLDLMLAFAKANNDEDRKKCTEETLPKYLGLLEGLMGSTFVVGSSLTLADLYLYCVIEFVNAVAVLEKYPKLKANREKVASLPRIKAYLSVRKVTKM